MKILYLYRRLGLFFPRRLLFVLCPYNADSTIRWSSFLIWSRNGLTSAFLSIVWTCVWKIKDVFNCVTIWSAKLFFLIADGRCAFLCKKFTCCLRGVCVEQQFGPFWVLVRKVSRFDKKNFHIFFQKTFSQWLFVGLAPSCVHWTMCGSGEFYVRKQKLPHLRLFLNFSDPLVTRICALIQIPPRFCFFTEVFSCTLGQLQNFIRLAYSQGCTLVLNKSKANWLLWLSYFLLVCVCKKWLS